MNSWRVLCSKFKYELRVLLYILDEIFSGRLCFRFLGAPLQDCQFRLGWRIGFRRWSLYEVEGEIRHLDTFGCYF